MSVVMILVNLAPEVSARWIDGLPSFQLDQNIYLDKKHYFYYIFKTQD